MIKRVSVLTIQYSFAKSQPFQFLVGPNAKPFYIHSALVEQLSKTLGTLVGGDMIEAHEGSARLDDIDESTFLLFTQFAYTGDFKDPKPDVVLSQSDISAGGNRSCWHLGIL